MQNRLSRFFAGACIFSLTACGSLPQTAEQKAKAAKGTDQPESECISRPVIERMRDSIFDAAIANAKEGTQNLNNLRAVLSGRIESPLLQSHDASIRRTACSGRLVFALPPNMHRVFRGETSLSAEVAYEIQPAADQSGLVVQITGSEPIVDALVNAVQTSKVARTQPDAGSSSKDFDGFGFDPPSTASLPPSSRAVPVSDIIGPSFPCGGKLNRVEQMICSDASLADQDRALASAWRDAKSRTTGSRKAALEAERQRYLSKRNGCGDALCVATTYDEWIAAMYSWSGD